MASRTKIFLSLLVLGGLVASCGPARSPLPPPPTAATTQKLPQEISGLIEATLLERGFSIVDRSNNAIIARLDGAGADQYVDCQRVKISDPFVEDGANRQRIVEPRESHALMNIVFAESDAGTEVRFNPDNRGTYNNSYVNLDFERRCASTGEIERVIVQALSG